ncbi:MAG: glutamate racemase [gamma proteobacterium symbiont of Taylorina sp.]|nr:glutamate racemase [gamma proteobacterium symbiont of Taylorina sp.]
MNIRLNTKRQSNGSNNSPIGIFDSGVGGLSVLQRSRQLLPQENFIYVADSGYAPWGSKDHHFIEQRSKIITEHLLEQGAKLIVIACNTATASIIEKFRHQYGIPFIGVEPGIKPAISVSKNGNIGIMATQGTLASQRYNELKQRFSHTVNLYHTACPGLADQVESCQINTAKTMTLLENFVQPLLTKQVDSIVLGCTHYSFLIPLMQKLVGDSILLIDTSHAVAEQIARIIKQYSLQNNEGNGLSQFFTTGDIEKTRLVMSSLLGHKIENLNALK